MLPPKSSRVSFSISSSVALLLALPGSAPSQEPKAVRPAIVEWIRQLGSTLHEEREKAEAILSSSDDAAPALREALKSPDPEVRRRAGRALQAVDRRRHLAALALLQKFAKEGQVLLAADLLVQTPHLDDEEDAWQAVTEWAERLSAAEARTFGRRSIPEGEAAPLGDFRKYIKSLEIGIVKDPLRVSWNERGGARFVAKGESFVDGFKNKFISSSLLVSSGDVRAKHVRSSVVLAGGSVEVDTMFQTIVVCDGDFTMNEVLVSCLVIARGAIHCRADAGNSRFISSDRVHCGKRMTPSQNVIKEGEANPLGLVKFFDLKHVGLATEAGESGLRVKAVDKGSRAARAGLRAGDVLVTADAKKVASAEAFRKLIRGAVAEGRPVPLTVHRADRDLTLSLDGKD